MLGHNCWTNSTIQTAQSSLTQVTANDTILVTTKTEIYEQLQAQIAHFITPNTKSAHFQSRCGLWRKYL